MSTEKTLHVSEYNIIIWISLINNQLYDINITDKLLNVTYRIAEYDGHKYNVLNQKAFDGVYYPTIKENPGIIRVIHDFIDYHQPESRSFDAMRDRVSSRFNIWLNKKIKSLNWQK